MTGGVPFAVAAPGAVGCEDVLGPGEGVEVDQGFVGGVGGPAQAAAVSVAGRVVRRRGGDTVAGQCFGDREQAASGEVFAEDPLHDGGAVGSGASWCSRLPSAALAGFGWGSASMSR